MNRCHSLDCLLYTPCLIPSALSASTQTQFHISLSPYFLVRNPWHLTHSKVLWPHTLTKPLYHRLIQATGFCDLFHLLKTLAYSSWSLTVLTTIIALSSTQHTAISHFQRLLGYYESPTDPFKSTRSHLMTSLTPSANVLINY